MGLPLARRRPQNVYDTLPYSQYSTAFTTLDCICDALLKLLPVTVFTVLYCIYKVLYFTNYK